MAGEALSVVRGMLTSLTITVLLVVLGVVIHVFYRCFRLECGAGDRTSILSIPVIGFGPDCRFAPFHIV
jgi:hypothetical protein